MLCVLLLLRALSSRWDCPPPTRCESIIFSYRPEEKRRKSGCKACRRGKTAIGMASGGIGENLPCGTAKHAEIYRNLYLILTIVFSNLYLLFRAESADFRGAPCAPFVRAPPRFSAILPALDFGADFCAFLLFVHIAKRQTRIYGRIGKNIFVKKIENYSQNARNWRKGIAII